VKDAESTAEQQTEPTEQPQPEQSGQQPDPQAQAQPQPQPEPQPDPQALAELHFAEGFDKTCALLRANPLYRPVLFRILTYCDGARRELPELEEYVAALPEFAQSTHPQYFLIMWLAESDALDMFEIDAEGAVLSDERKAGLSADEIDDLVEGWSFETNEIGRAVIGEFEPRQRLLELLTSVPERYETYVEVLGFLEKRRSFAEVDALLRGRDVLMVGREPGDRPLQPSVFVDKLAAYGGINFNNGWMVTKEGKELLDAIREGKV
jgi:hypothetical protein